MSKIGKSQEKSRTILTSKDQDLRKPPGEETQKGGTKKKMKYKKPAYLNSLNESEKAANFQIIDRMNKRVSYLKNPRYKVNKPPILLNQKAEGAPEDKVNPFRVEPKIVQFADYQINGIYEIPVKITNSSGVSRRLKYFPPATEHFSIRKVKLPSGKESLVAPGMSVSMFVTFSAPSFADFDDKLTLVTEENSFDIPIRARRQPPVIKLVNPMDCKSCWIGDRVDMAFKCQNTGGDGGFKFFCEKDEDDIGQDEVDTIKIGPFTLFPSEFYLYSGNSIDIFISFNPTEEGTQEQNLILACDNQTSEFYKLTGQGCMLDLDIQAVDGREVDTKKYPLETLYFPNTNPTSESKRTLTLKNQAPIPVSYHWSIYRSKGTEIVLKDEPTHYRAESNQGKIEAEQEIDFDIFFSPLHAEPYFEFIDFIIEGIPIQSMRNPPPALKEYAASAQKEDAKIPMPTYVGSNTQYLSIPLFQFALSGQGNFKQLQMDPPILVFPEDLYIGKTYKEKVVLQKESEGDVKYYVRVEGKNDPEFKVEIKDGSGNKCDDDSIMEHLMEKEKEVELTVTIECSTRGLKTAYLMVDVDDGVPMSFELRANFIGPLVKIHDPSIDFGLQKINTASTFKLTVENQSPIEAEIIIKNSKNRKLGFEMLSEEADTKHGDSQKALHRKTTSGAFGVGQKNSIFFTPQQITLKPKSKTQLTVHLDCNREEVIYEILELMVKNQESKFVNLRANIQAPKVCLSQHFLQLGTIYAGVKQEIGPDDKRALVVKNYGNIPARFKFDERNEEDHIRTMFEPRDGIIAPHSEVRVYFAFTIFSGGNFDQIFTCEINDLEYPLGFALQADVFGLSVSHQLPEDMVKAHVTQSEFRKTGSLRQKEEVVEQLNHLNFSSCTINKPCTQQFILKNLSGIKTKFDFKVLNYEPAQKKLPADIQGKSSLEEIKSETQSQGTRRVTRIKFAPGLTQSSVFGKRSQVTKKKLTRPILSDAHEVLNKFSSATGETFTATKRLEREQSFFLSNNKGVSITFNPDTGDLLPHSEIPVTVTVYNNACGRFVDTFVSQVKGLEPFQFNVDINITGSPLVVPENQVGLNYNTVPPTMAFPTCVDNAPVAIKTFKVKNTGIKAVKLDWKIFDQLDRSKMNRDGQDMFNIKIAENHSFDKEETPFKLDFKLNEPEESDDSCFEITPKECVVPARGVQVFEVKFYSDQGVQQFKSVVLAHPKLDDDEAELEMMEAEERGEEVQEKSLGIVSLKLAGKTIEPELMVDMKKRLDGEFYFNYERWSTRGEDDEPSSKNKIVLKNDTMANMIFNITSEGPFEIVKTKTNSGAVHPLSAQSARSKPVKPQVETMFDLQPDKILQIGLRFIAPDPRDLTQWPNIMKHQLMGKLNIAFANGKFQKYLIAGSLLRPRVNLVTEKASKNEKAEHELDFGTVNIERHRTLQFYLSNETKVTAKWQLNYIKFPQKSTVGYMTTTKMEKENMVKEDDPDVFEFSIAAGKLRGPSITLRQTPEGLAVPGVPKDSFEEQFLPQKIMVNFRPKANIIYKSRFKFVVDNGISCDVVLKGTGSYEEDMD